MLSNEILGRWTHLKNNMQNLLGRISENVQERLADKSPEDIKREDIHIDNYQYESHRVDDLPLTTTKDSAPGVRYSYTENSEFARGAEKEQAHGIDSFDDYQDYRKRNQDSDLGQRHDGPAMDDFH